MRTFVLTMLAMNLGGAIGHIVLFVANGQAFSLVFAGVHAVMFAGLLAVSWPRLSRS